MVGSSPFTSKEVILNLNISVYFDFKQNHSMSVLPDKSSLWYCVPMIVTIICFDKKKKIWVKFGVTVLYMC